MSKLVELNLNPDRRTLRQFGVLAFFGFGLLASLAYYEKLIFSFGLGSARTSVVSAFVAIALLSLLFTLVAPAANRLLYVGLSVIAFPIGFVLSYLIMGTLYFLIIGPIAIGFRLAGRDSLKRRYDPGATTYWEQARPPRDKDSYFHQY